MKRIAIDTNVLVRLLVEDDRTQFLAAEQIVTSADIVTVATTVILETEWVLRSAYGVGREEFAERLADFIALPRVRLIDRDIVLAALADHRAGLDFADALHLAATPEDATFLTFDRSLARRAAEMGHLPGVDLAG